MHKLRSLWNRWPLAVKLTLTMTLLVVLAVGSVTLLSIRREQQTFRAELEQQADLLLDSLEAVVADPLYYLKTDNLSDIMEALGRDRHIIVSGNVYDPAGRIVADAYDEAVAFNLEINPLGEHIVVGHQ